MYGVGVVFREVWYRGKMCREGNSWNSVMALQEQLSALKGTTFAIESSNSLRSAIRSIAIDRDQRGE
jgi:hypothetical protein